MVISGFGTPDPGAWAPIGGGDTCIRSYLTLEVGYEVPSSVKLTKPSSFGIRGKLRAETFLRNFKIYFVLNVIKPYSIAENVLNIKCHLLVYIHQTRYELNSLGPQNISFRHVRPASGIRLHLLIC